MKPEPRRVPEIIAPSPVCIAVRRVLRVMTTTIIRYPAPNGKWVFTRQTVML